MLYDTPNTKNSPVQFRDKYDNFINGEWVAPVDGEYFDNLSPIDGKTICQVARSKEADIEKALDAAHAAKDAWGKTSVTERANLLLKIADKMEENLEAIAIAECYENGKAVRETLAADIPLAIDLSATLPAPFARKKAVSAKLMKIPSLTTSMNL